MVVLSDIFNMLAFRGASLEKQAFRRMFAGSVACFAIGYMIYTLVRNRVYAVLVDPASRPPGLLRTIADLNLIQTLVFVLVIYVPTLVWIGRVIRGGGPGSSFSWQDYRAHVSALLPLWGALFLISAPVQWMVPHFLRVGVMEISVGYLCRSTLVSIYTAWAVKQLNGLTTAQAAVAFVLSWITLPLLYLLSTIRLA
jgi:hypothetical protein